MGELFSRRIAGYGVTLPMYRVMAALWETGDQRLGDLAAVTALERSTLSRLVGEMKRRGLVTRTRLKDNGRTVAINLAPKGRTLVEELMPIAVHFEEVAVRNFRPRDVVDLKTVLEEIHQSLKSLESEIEEVNLKRKALRSKVRVE